MQTLTQEWNRIAGSYIRAADAVRAADHDPKVSDDTYRQLVAAREIAYAAIDTYQQAQRQADTLESPESRVERGLFPEPGPHCVTCAKPLTAAEAAVQAPDCDEVCAACDDSAGVDHKRLLSELKALPAYHGWRFTYEYPGLFCYHHPSSKLSVFFTPDWSADGEMPIEVQDNEGSCIDFTALPLPHAGRSGQQLFDLVRPTLDKHQPAAPEQPQPQSEAYHDGYDS